LLSMLIEVIEVLRGQETCRFRPKREICLDSMA